jgi:hypothetical protein
MNEQTTPAGAMPVAAGAMPTQSYPVGPGWAAYRLPFLTSISARDAGVWFEGEPAAGATPAAPGTPAAPPPTTPPASQPPSPPPATGEPELGEAGKKAIAAERKTAKEAQEALKTAQDELEALKAASLTDSEKAIKTAKTEAAAEERAKYETMLRRAGVRSELRAKGLSEGLAELALKDDRFSALKVDADGRVAEVDKAVEAFLKDYPEMVKPAGAGTVTTGAQTGQAAQAKDLESAIAAHYTKH